MTSVPAVVRRGLSVLSFGVAVVVVAAPESALAQCAMCRDAVNAAPPQVREAMNYAIVGLALAPYVIAIAAAWTLSPALRAYIRARFNRT